MKYLVILLDYMALIALVTTIFAGFRMGYFLKKRGIEKSALYSFNPLFFLNYMRITKDETGTYGIWFKICVTSFIITILSGVSGEILDFIIR